MVKKAKGFRLHQVHVPPIRKVEEKCRAAPGIKKTRVGHVGWGTRWALSEEPSNRVEASRDDQRRRREVDQRGRVDHKVLQVHRDGGDQLRLCVSPPPSLLSIVTYFDSTIRILTVDSIDKHGSRNPSFAAFVHEALNKNVVPS